MMRTLLFSLLAAAGLALGAQGTSPGDSARYLAGLDLPAASALAPLAKEKAFTAHAAAMKKAWSAADKDRLTAMRQFSAKELASQRSLATVFYPFGGPDLLHVRTFLPGAKTYILVGLEKPGQLADLAAVTPDKRATELALLRKSLNASLAWSFFKTNDMKVDLKDRSLSGVLPILCTYAALLGEDVKRVEPIRLDEKGQPQVDAKGPGLRLQITPTSGQAYTLYYFSWDLSDDSLTKAGERLVTFLKAQGPGMGYLKSASYLMHRPAFSVIRGFLLDHCPSLLQDDSGIPHKFFPAERWEARLFGTYDRPIRLFQERHQADLLALFKKGPATPLAFGVGYQFKGQGKESNLVLYVRKTP